jgi:2'-5' RNA ligase
LAAPGPLIRAFVGIPLPEAQRTALSSYVTACAERHPGFRWGRAENLHLTLRFLGSIDSETFQRVESLLGRIHAPAFELALDDVGSFGSGRLKRVLWLGVAAGAEPAASLAATVEKACVEAGLAPEDRPFRAHITLARARDRRGAPAPEIPDPPPLEAWQADEFVLYQSKLGAGGPHYLPLRRFSLAT